jgi:hypothetical protein
MLTFLISNVEIDVAQPKSRELYLMEKAARVVAGVGVELEDHDSSAQ